VRHVTCPMLRIGAVLLVLILMIGHSAGVQLIGWAGMLVSRTAERGLVSAVQSTVSGDEPCALCNLSKTIAAKEQGAADDGKQMPNPGGKSVKKPDFAHVEWYLVPTSTIGRALVYARVVPAFLAMSPLAPEPPPPRFI
jgi:hypothetical protein